MKKLTKDVVGLGGINIGIGVGSAIAAKTGYGGSAFATMGSMMGPVTTGVMGMHTLRMVKKNLKPTKRRRY